MRSFLRGKREGLLANHPRQVFFSHQQAEYLAEVSRHAVTKVVGPQANLKRNFQVSDEMYRVNGESLLPA
jgi:hypothetical protein